MGDMSNEPPSAYEVYKYLKNIGNGSIPSICLINSLSTSVVRWSKNLKLTKKYSASPSEVIFADMILSALNPDAKFPVSIKIFMKRSAITADIDSDLGGLIYESGVYEYILKHIIAPNLSPNFVSFVGFGCCNGNFINKNNIEYPSYGNSQEDKQALYNTKKMLENMRLRGECILITERAGEGSYFGQPGMHPVSTLSETMKIINNTIDSQCVLFQIFYALQLLAINKITHYDMHTNNILVMKLQKPVTMGFKIENRFYMVKTSYIPYLFDWDFSYCEELGNNPKLKGMEFINAQNTFNPYFDVYTLLCTLAGGGFDDGIFIENNSWIPIENEYRINREQYNKALLLKPIDNIGGMGGDKVYKIASEDDLNYMGLPAEWFMKAFIVKKHNDGNYSLQMVRRKYRLMDKYYEAQENSKTLTLTMAQYNKIKSENSIYSKFTLATGRDVDVYKLTGKQLGAIFPEMSDIKSSFIYLSYDSGKYYLHFYKGFVCRISTVSEKTPTAMNVLDSKYFNMLLRPKDVILAEIKNQKVKLLYELPKNIVNAPANNIKVPRSQAFSTPPREPLTKRDIAAIIPQAQQRPTQRSQSPLRLRQAQNQNQKNQNRDQGQNQNQNYKQRSARREIKAPPPSEPILPSHIPTKKPEPTRYISSAQKKDYPFPPQQPSYRNNYFPTRYIGQPKEKIKQPLKYIGADNYNNLPDEDIVMQI